MESNESSYVSSPELPPKRSSPPPESPASGISSFDSLFLSLLNFVILPDLLSLSRSLRYFSYDMINMIRIVLYLATQ